MRRWVEAEDVKIIDDLEKACKRLLEAGMQPMASGAVGKCPLSDLAQHRRPRAQRRPVQRPKDLGRPKVEEAFRVLAELLEMGCYGPREERIAEKWETQVVRLIRGSR